MPHYVQILSFSYPTVPKLLLHRNSFKYTVTTAALNTFTLLSGDLCTTLLKCFSNMSNVLTSLQFMLCVTCKPKADRHIQFYILPSTDPSSPSSFITLGFYMQNTMSFRRPVDFSRQEATMVF